jgi:hypothetical protein
MFKLSFPYQEIKDDELCLVRRSVGYRSPVSTLKILTLKMNTSVWNKQRLMDTITSQIHRYGLVYDIVSEQSSFVNYKLTVKLTGKESDLACVSDAVNRVISL